MSGGAWGYLQYELERRAEDARATFQLLAQLEHEMDWAISGDSCRECAKERIYKALHCFFETTATDAMSAIAVLRDSKQNLCSECEKRGS